MKYEVTKLPDVFYVRRGFFNDARGYFSKLYDSQLNQSCPMPFSVEQVNVSYNASCATLRGMHYQAPPFADHKLVSCLQGRIWDVALDLRQHSPTFLQYFAKELDADKGDSLLLAPGIAHGFQTLTADAVLLYLHSQPYKPELDGRINPFDPRLAIPWPYPDATVSEKDRMSPFLAAEYEGIIL